MGWLVLWLPSNQAQHVEARPLRLDLIFHSAGNGRYNALDAHLPVGLMQHEQLSCPDQMDGDNADIEFAYIHSFLVSSYHDKILHQNRR